MSESRTVNSNILQLLDIYVTTKFSLQYFFIQNYFVIFIVIFVNDFVYKLHFL